MLLYSGKNGLKCFHDLYRSFLFLFNMILKEQLRKAEQLKKEEDERKHGEKLRKKEQEDEEIAVSSGRTV